MPDSAMQPNVPGGTARKRILMFGYLPPPYFGPSITYQALLHSGFPRAFDVVFVDVTVSGSIGDLEQFRAGKVLKMLGFLMREFWLLLTGRFDFCCCPLAFNRNGFVKDALLLGLARAFGVPTVIYAHNNNLPDFYERSAPWVQRLIGRTASRAAGVIVLGESLRFNFERWLPPEKIFVAPTGIEPVTPLPQAPKDGRTISVVYLGNLVPEKGVFVVLEAAARILQQRRDVRFMLAGAWFKTADEQRARDYVLREGLSDHVKFIDRVVGEQKWRLLAGSDLLVFPTFYYYETMGLVLLEAMQAGLPVVTTRRASIPEIIQDGVNGLLVNEQDPADLAEKILRLANDPALREQMGRANRERFEREYTHEQYGQRMIGVFDKLSGGGPRPQTPGGA